jgi:hypothetical protein
MDKKSVREVEKIRRLEGFSSSKPLNLFGFFNWEVSNELNELNDPNVLNVLNDPNEPDHLNDLGQLKPPNS